MTVSQFVPRPADPGRSTADEDVDVVIVGARCAGAAAAVPLARAGRNVLVLDRVKFPADTLSSHTMLPVGVSELLHMGALPGILALSPTRCRRLRVTVDAETPREMRIEETFTPIEGIDYALSVPRDLHDKVLVDTMRAAGARIRERATVVGLTWQAGRVSGVRYVDEDGRERVVRCRLVMGADGRHSTVARLVGAAEPYRSSANGRAGVVRYLDDQPPDPDEADVVCQWRDGAHLAFGFPGTPIGRYTLFFMGSPAEAAMARRDPDAYWAMKMEHHPGVARRLRHATNMSAFRGTDQLVAYFRPCSGPGWVLIGDSGHFKDPSLGQGMRDAMWAGRHAATAAMRHLDDLDELDLAMRRFEHDRDQECLPAYYFGNGEALLRPTPRPFKAFIESARDDVDRPFTSVGQRIKTPQQLLRSRLVVGGVARTLLVADDRRGFLREMAGEGRVQAAIVRALIHSRTRFRSTIPADGAENDLASAPASVPPAVVATSDDDVPPAGDRPTVVAREAEAVAS
ncbi:hypothetical protein GCM10009547_43330 [Sporichthya brevicatena]|uniref:FAD-binding domain-containing protein n=1 Tax=Sporichthya brevicatena TaxID=171442 RepID=A0ABN1H9Z3_9ACTN